MKMTIFKLIKTFLKIDVYKLGMEHQKRKDIRALKKFMKEFEKI